MEIEEAIIPLHKPRHRRIRPWHVVLLLILGIGAYSIHTWARESEGFFTMHMMDIGQGDALFITSPTGHQILIDGGRDGVVLSRLSRYMPSWDKDLDMVIASHKDSDHITGLVAVLEQYDVGHIVHGFERPTTAIGRAWDEAVAGEGAIVTEGVAGLEIDLGASTSLSVLYPYDSRAGFTPENANNESIVVRIRHKSVVILLTGDAEAPVERQLVTDGVPLRADILKAGHHGSKTSTIAEFVSAVSPQVVLISAGRDNRYGHPHQSVISRLESFGISYYRTDQKGDVTVKSDGRSFSIFTQY